MSKNTISKSIFREYDIRGIINKTLENENAYEIARGFCSLNKIHTVVVCRDGRESSPTLTEFLIKGVLKSGVNVIDIGCGPTPMLYFASIFLKSDAAFMVTGSHNPVNYNGFKIVLKNKSFFGNDLQKLYRSIKKQKFVEGNGTLKKTDVKNIYVDQLLKKSGPFPDLKVIWDCGNGSTGQIVSSLVKKLPGKHYVLFSKIDGKFPNHHPDPTIKENLKQLKLKMDKEKADLGIAFDGDGDRIGILTKEKDLVPGDILTAFLSGGVIFKGGNNKIVLDIKSSFSAINSIEKQGGVAYLHKTGHSNIKNILKEIKAPLAGEVSGHIFFNDFWFGFDDAPYAALRVLGEIKRRNYGITKFKKNLTKYYTSPEIRINCDDNKKFQIVKKISSMAITDFGSKNCNKIDGIRVDSKDGWWLIRASNTEASLIVRFEARDKKNYNSIINKIVFYLEIFNLKIKYKNLNLQE